MSRPGLTTRMALEQSHGFYNIRIHKILYYIINNILLQFVPKLFHGDW